MPPSTGFNPNIGATGDQRYSENEGWDAAWSVDWLLLGDNPAQATMAWSSVIAAIAALVAAILLYTTLCETRRVGMAQVRAYLGVSSISFGEHEHRHDPLVRYRVVFRLRNFGQSLASEVSATTRCSVNGCTVNALAANEERDVLSHQFGIINPNHEPEGLIDMGEIASVHDIRLRIEITYKDAFNRRWLQVAEYFPVPDDGPSGNYTMSVLPGTSRERPAP